MGLCPQRLAAILFGAGALLTASGLHAQGFDEAFATDPAKRWSVFGDSALFAWDRTTSALQVTWDSRRPNSYFARPLGTVMNRQDGFHLAFTLRLDHLEVGVNPGKPHTFELAVGFLNWRNATNASFARGTGATSPNIVEFDYFPDSGYGATVWPTFVGRDGRWNYSGSDDFTLLELEPAVLHRIEMDYTAADQTLRTRLWREGVLAGPIKDVRLASRFTDYAVDTFAVSSYSDQGAQGSLRAQGSLDDITVRVPPSPVGEVTGRFVEAAWRVGFEARTNWVYFLERSGDVGSWSAVATNALEGTNGPLELTDPLPLAHAFYRVRADKP